jgi:TM2 domain-containing membrane protein YozV
MVAFRVFSFHGRHRVQFIQFYPIYAGHPAAGLLKLWMIFLPVFHKTNAIIALWVHITEIPRVITEANRPKRSLRMIYHGA